MLSQFFLKQSSPNLQINLQASLNKVLVDLSDFGCKNVPGKRLLMYVIRIFQFPEERHLEEVLTNEETLQVHFSSSRHFV